jgi:hypothetical protein
MQLAIIEYLSIFSPYILSIEYADIIGTVQLRKLEKPLVI